MAPSKPQVNVRLTAQEQDVLDAIVFLREKSASEVVRPVVAAFLADQAADADVAAALEIRARVRGDS